MMASVDQFEAAAKIADACGALSDVEIRKAILMALVSLDKAELLVDPRTIGIAMMPPVLRKGQPPVMLYGQSTERNTPPTVEQQEA